MNEEQTEHEDLSMWFSTYGLVTISRILARYNIQLEQDDLIKALKTPNTFYRRLIQLPLKNVLNGIIYQQAHDYQVYAQKLFVDYLLAGQGTKDDNSPGYTTREELEEERQKLMAMSETLHELELEHYKLISESQSLLIKHAAAWNQAMVSVNKGIRDFLRRNNVSKTEEQVKQIVTKLLVQYDFKKESAMSGDKYRASVEAILGVTLTAEMHAGIMEQLATLNNFSAETDAIKENFSDKVTQMTARLKQFRSDFSSMIVRVNALIMQLSDYKIDKNQVEINRQELYFDPGIGDESS
ncbi:hypothetical protein [Legionella spiritensis]|uniref:hypothetical protein n=1 Tax=Legionella spiritensis TaxID=452 RepID=UPI000F6FB293|nr:hypothetical protein [Legionella spiritensis]VEG90379.1 Uncharacterised protein [Legionella spiritensis]